MSRPYVDRVRSFRLPPGLPASISFAHFVTSRLCVHTTSPSKRLQSNPVVRLRRQPTQGLQGRDQGRAVPLRQDEHHKRRPSQARSRGGRAALRGEWVGRVAATLDCGWNTCVQLMPLPLPLKLVLLRPLVFCALGCDHEATDTSVRGDWLKCENQQQRRRKLTHAA